jgi:hypothetical protein
VRKPTLEVGLRRWWVKKYQLPWTHELAQSATLSDILVEFYEDYYTEHPEEARKITSADGEVVFTETGDPLLDKWEQEFAQGLTPDMEEGLSSQEKDKLRKEREKSKRARQAAGQLEFEEDYSKPLKKDMDHRFESKFATPGSKEERELLGPKLSKSQVLGGTEVERDDAWMDMLMGGNG